MANEKTLSVATGDEDRETLADLAVIRVTFSDGRLLQRFLTLGSYAIGRNRGDLILKGDHRVSSTHAQLEVTPGQVFITDLGSTNGTWDTSGQRIVGQRRLFPGEPVRLGDCLLELHRQSGSESPDVSATRHVGPVSTLTKVTHPAIPKALISSELAATRGDEPAPDSDRNPRAGSTKRG